jgi:hypothetical protein
LQNNVHTKASIFVKKVSLRNVLWGTASHAMEIGYHVAPMGQEEKEFWQEYLKTRWKTPVVRGPVEVGPLS